VPSSERFAPPNTYYNNNYYPPGSHPQHSGPPDMHNGGPPPNMTPGFIPPQGPPPDHPGYRPMYYGQYPPPGPPHMGYMRPPYPPDHMPPPDSWRYRAPYPGTPPPGPTFYGEQQIQRYPANAVQPYTPSPAPRLQVSATLEYSSSRCQYYYRDITTYYHVPGKRCAPSYGMPRSQQLRNAALPGNKAL